MDQCYGRVMERPFDLPALLSSLAEGHVHSYRYFWGHRPTKDGSLGDSCFSQWWACRFEIDGRLYTSAEQWMMASKARLFGDRAVLAEVMGTSDPAQVKSLGRRVQGFEENSWAALRFDLVTIGNVAKFGQNEDLRRHLLGTGESVLVEASPSDRIWGIGLGRDAPEAKDPRTWRGRNLLGFALVRTRAVLRKELEVPALPLLDR